MFAHSSVPVGKKGRGESGILKRRREELPLLGVCTKQPAVPCRRGSIASGQGEGQCQYEGLCVFCQLWWPPLGLVDTRLVHSTTALSSLGGQPWAGCLGCCDNRAVQQTDSHKPNRTEMKTIIDSCIICNVYMQSTSIWFGKMLCVLAILIMGHMLNCSFKKTNTSNSKTLAFVQKGTRWVLMYVLKCVFESLSVKTLAPEPCSPGTALQKNAFACAPLQPLCFFQP